MSEESLRREFWASKDRAMQERMASIERENRDLRRAVDEILQQIKEVKYDLRATRKR